MSRLTVESFPAGGMAGRMKNEHVIGEPAGWVAARLYGRTDAEAEAVRLILSGATVADGSMVQRAGTWDAVCKALSEARPGWLNASGMSGIECAVAAIRALAEEAARCRVDAARWHDVAERFGNVSTGRSERVLQGLGYPDEKPWLSLAEIVDATRTAGKDGAG